jgi:hypothetical protein
MLSELIFSKFEDYQAVLDCNRNSVADLEKVKSFAAFFPNLDKIVIDKKNFIP